MDRKDGDVIQLGSTSSFSDSHTVRLSQPQESSLKNEGSEAHKELSRQGSAQEDKSSESLSVKLGRAYIQGEPEDARDSILKGCMKSHILLSPTTADVAVGKCLSHNHMLILANSSERQEAARTHLGMQSLAAVISEILFFHHWHQCWEAPFQNLFVQPAGSRGLPHPPAGLQQTGRVELTQPATWVKCSIYQQVCSCHEPLGWQSQPLGQTAPPTTESTPGALSGIKPSNARFPAHLPANPTATQVSPHRLLSQRPPGHLQIPSYWLCHRRAYTAHSGCTPETSSSDGQRGACSWILYLVGYSIKPLLQDQNTQWTCSAHRNKTENQKA